MSLPYEQINLKNSNYSNNVDLLSTSSSSNVEMSVNEISNIDGNYKLLRNIMENNIKDIKLKEKDLKEKKILMKSKMSEINEILNILSNYEK